MTSSLGCKALSSDGFPSLPRRSRLEKKELELPKITVPIVGIVDVTEERFYSGSTGSLPFLPFPQYGIEG